MLETDFCIFSSPIYLLTRVEHAIPTPIAGIKEACIIVKMIWVVASSTTPIIPTTFKKKVQPKAIMNSCVPIGRASRNCPQNISLSREKERTLNLSIKSPENR